ncbi:MAG: hypothetical protein QXX08_09415, partial [Candidatus Bathyarchaeia archaeon]
SAKGACEFSHKNDILSLIEEILHWTKNDQNIWFNNFYLTTIASTVLLKMGHSKYGLNISWIEGKLKELQSKKRYLTNVDLFAGYCLGLLCLYFVNRKKANDIISSVKKLQAELENLNWMNNPKTAAFLIILLYEVANREKRMVRDITDGFERYLTRVIEGEIGQESLAYALFSLSFIDPEKVRQFFVKNKQLIDQLTSHKRIEIRALTLDFLDKAEIPCAEGTYQAIWNFFEEQRYGTVERSLLGGIVSAIYCRTTGLPYRNKDVKIKEFDDIARLEVNISKASLQRMVQKAPPIDQLSMVALSILWSNYDNLYVFSRRRYEEYKTLQHLETKDTHTPIQKQALSKICSKLSKYEISKLLLKYGFLIVLILVIFPYVGSILGTHLPLVPEPWRVAVGGILAAITGVVIFLPYLLRRASTEYKELRGKIEKLRNAGIWEGS